MQSSADLAFPFRQDSNFWYLTGLLEPDHVLIINTHSRESLLLLPEQNDYQKEWDGENKLDHLTLTSGITVFGRIDELSAILKKARSENLRVGYLAPLDEIVQPYGFYANPARRRAEVVIKSVVPEPVDTRVELARLRSIKQPEEVEAIVEAIAITGATLKDVRAKLTDIKNEKEVERAITAGFYEKGGDGHAYEPIVASGKNASTIHYTKNSDTIQTNELLLLDVGAQKSGYAADITRTWGVGDVSPRQREVFDVVMSLQQEALSMLRPGVQLKEYQQKLEKKARVLCKQIGITLKRYPHGFSHFLGLDVHDAGDYSQPLQENMVLTVEPGLYLPKEGIGVRIEDNVLITRGGVKVLSELIPKDL